MGCGASSSANGTGSHHATTKRHGVRHHVEEHQSPGPAVSMSALPDDHGKNVVLQPEQQLEEWSGQIDPQGVPSRTYSALRAHSASVLSEQLRPVKLVGSRELHSGGRASSSLSSLSEQKRRDSVVISGRSPPSLGAVQAAASSSSSLLMLQHPAPPSFPFPPPLSPIPSPSPTPRPQVRGISSTQLDDVNRNLGGTSAAFPSTSLVGGSGMYSWDDLTRVGLIHESASGSVFKVRSRQIGQLFALKSIKGPVVTAADEIRCMTSLRGHPNLTYAYKVFKSPQHIHLLMNLCRCSLFDALVKMNGRLPEALCARIILQAITGLEYMHANNFLHGDIKPENALLNYSLGDEDSKDIFRHLMNPSLVVKLADFGMSYAFPPGISTVSHRGGTWAYSPPEKVAGLPIGLPHDLWGVIHGPHAAAAVPTILAPPQLPS